MRGKHIVIGVCGSIAAYKAATLIRIFIKAEAEVKVVMTESACSFITPLTLSTLSKNPVIFSLTDNETGVWHNHVELALWADIIVIAPATAQSISKFAHGGCDDMLSALYLSAKCPVFIAPAMDLDMWAHPASQSNINLLKSYGNFIIHPGTGDLASGLKGEGRLAEPEEISSTLQSWFDNHIR